MFVPLLQRELGIPLTDELEFISVAEYRSDDKQTWKTTPAVAKLDRLLEQAQSKK